MEEQTNITNLTALSLISESLQQASTNFHNDNTNSVSLIEITGDTNDLKSSEISENLSKSIDLAKNYSLLISKLEELTSGLSNDFNNNNNNNGISDSSIKRIELIQPMEHSYSEKEYARFVSDIWIGVVLTLLISSIVFFICSCFLYHKFQQWKQSCRQEHSSDPTRDIVRHFEFDVESLPSYTIVSGLPTYDDALEQIRKPGLLITTPNISKLFENYKQQQEQLNLNQSVDNIQTKLSGQDADSQDTSITIEGSTGNSTLSMQNSQQLPPTIVITNQNESGATNSSTSHNNNDMIGNNITQIIELGPEQLNLLSQKRLSVQIAFSAPSMSRSQLNLANGKLNVHNNDYPLLHGRTPSLSVRHLQNRRASDFLRNSIYIKNVKRNAQHRGSLG